MPPLYNAADDYAIKWQRRFLTAQKVQLISLIIAAVGGSGSWTIFTNLKLSASLSIIGLMLALFAKLYLLQNNPEKKWYNGRAAAESIKTMAWKYALCAAPFGKNLSDDAARSLFIKRVGEVLKTSVIDVAVQNGDSQITDSMSDIRKDKIKDRVAYYKKRRVDDQITWYRNKSRFNEKRASAWGYSVLIFELIALVAAILRFGGITDFDFSGIIAAAAAAALSWIQSKQFETLSQSYSVTSHELARVTSTLTNVRTEAEWSNLVEQSEEAISREHTLWVASRNF